MTDQEDEKPRSARVEHRGSGKIEIPIESIIEMLQNSLKPKAQEESK